MRIQDHAHPGSGISHPGSGREWFTTIALECSPADRGQLARLRHPLRRHLYGTHLAQLPLIYWHELVATNKHIENTKELANYQGSNSSTRGKDEPWAPPRTAPTSYRGQRSASPTRWTRSCSCAATRSPLPATRGTTMSITTVPATHRIMATNSNPVSSLLTLSVWAGPKFPQNRNQKSKPQGDAE
jgi:hypothetical protein